MDTKFLHIESLGHERTIRMSSTNREIIRSQKNWATSNLSEAL